MKILMVLDSEYPPDIRVEKETETLVEAGHEICLLCYRHHRSVDRTSVEDRIKVIREYLPLQIAKKSKGLIFHLPFYRWFWTKKLTKIIESFQPAVLHVHDLPLMLPALEVREKKKFPVVLDLHENYPYLLKEVPFTQRFPGNLFFDFQEWVDFEQAAVREADNIIVVSELNKERLAEEYNRSESVLVIPNTSRLDEFRNAVPSPEVRSWFCNGAINLLYIGGLDMTRGLDIVLKGLAQVIDEETAPAEGGKINFVVVGDGPYRDQMEKIVRLLDLKNYVNFTGKVSQQKVGEFIICSDICLLPLKLNKHTDLTDPNKLYQYIYYSKPVLAARTRQLQHRLNELEFGDTYYPGSFKDFAYKLGKIIKNPEQFSRYGGKARKHFEEKYYWERTSRPLKELYRSFN